jgi:hypothetical protein
MLTANGIKQEVSYLYLHALATRLGYALERTSIDMDSVDATICARGKIPGSKGVILSPKVDIQLKATEQGSHSLSFRLPKKNYDDLRQHTMVPKVLVVLFLPTERGWFNWDPERISLHGRAYWKSLKGMDESENVSSVTIHLLESQRLSDETLQQWMIAAANREEFIYAPC